MPHEIDWPALLAAEREATAGPWDVDAGGRVYDEEGVPLCTARDEDGVTLGGQTRKEAQANAEYIALSRAAVPALVAMVRELAGALERVSREHQAYTSGVDQYQIGVTDGHRCAAQIARTALAAIPAVLLEVPRD